jgi:glutathione S-transferase
MNLHRHSKPPASPLADEVRANIARIEAIWSQSRKLYGKGGPFLFGKFTIADAMYAPVVTRFDTYAIPVCSSSREYMDAVSTTAAFRAWKAGAVKEKWIIAADEVD